MLTEQSCLAVLKQQGVDLGTQCFDHEAVDTAAQQVKALSTKGCPDATRIAKNLFLKDNRNRYFVCTALSNTTVPFEKELSIRLGLKKNELRMADAEAMQSVLGVAPGSVTPLAACQPTASRVILLLDKALKDAPFYIHPMTNTKSVRVSAEQLDAFLQKHGKQGHYVDLSVTDVKIGPDNPPDLKLIAATVTEEKVKGEAKGVAAGTDSKKEAKAARQAQKQGGKGAKSSTSASCETIDSVSACVAALLDMVRSSAATAVQQKQELSGEQLRRVARDMEMEINSLRNAAYARGMTAAKGAIAAHVLGEWK